MEKREKYRQRVIDRLIKSGTGEDLALREIVVRANMSDHWSYEGEVFIGDARNIGEFATLIFHESAHQHYGLHTNLEDEKKCYAFSREVCQRLKLPYNKLIEKCGISCVELASQFSTDEKSFVTEVEKFPIAIRNILSLGPQRAV